MSLKHPFLRAIAWIANAATLVLALFLGAMFSVVVAALLGAGGDAHAAENPRFARIGSDVTRIEEDRWLRPGGKAALLEIESQVGTDADREPLVLVHGIQGSPSEFQAVIERFKEHPGYRLYVLAYDDFHRRTSLNGKDLAGELGRLAALRPGRGLTIVAHSMGGVLTRWALNELEHGEAGGIRRLGRIRFIAVDTPWHGYAGPSDRGLFKPFMAAARVFLPDGLEDMRAASDVFQGEPDARSTIRRQGMYGRPLDVEAQLVFSKGDTVAWDYTEGPLTELPSRLVRLYRDDEPVRGSPQLMNFWRALLQSRSYFAFQDEMRAARDLNEALVLDALERHFPRFPGDHTTMLTQRHGAGDFLSWLERELAR